MNPLTPSSTPDQILETALGKEREAYAFYSGMAAQCKIEDVRRLIESLKDEEHRHVRLIEAMLARLRSGHG